MIFCDLGTRRIQPLGLLNPTKLCPGLVVVRRQTKSKPRTGIPLRAPVTLPDLTQHVVVALGVAPEVLLDAREHGRHDLIPCEDERLQDSRHPTIAVPEWMHHHEV